MSQSEIGGYVDLQVNGYQGVDFNDPNTSRDQYQLAVRAMQADGVVLALPTVITGPLDSMLQCIRNLVSAIQDDEVVASMFAGIHIEGPFLSPQPGFIGAHPVEHARTQDASALEALCDAGGEHVKLVTLAPEVDFDAVMTKWCVGRGIRVAAGHTDASLKQLETCISAGLSLFTHLGNGCPKLLDRHDNIIYRALRFRDRMSYSLIADGFHIPEVLFRNLLEWISLDRICVVSDAISAAGLGPGTYRLGKSRVRIGPDKAARDPSGQNFMGSACTMRDADGWLETVLQCSQDLRRRLMVDNPARFLRDLSE